VTRADGRLKPVKATSRDAAFHATLEAAAKGEVNKSLGSLDFIDTEKLTKGQLKCGDVLLWLCEKPRSGDATSMLPSSALPLLP